MRDINSTFKSEKNKQENQPIYLYTIYDYDGSNTNLYFAQYESDVTFNGVTYSRFPIDHELVGENSEGQIDSVKVRVSNVDRTIQGYLESYDLRGKRVDIKQVWANQLGDANAHLTDTFYIDSYTANQDVVEFTLTSKFDVLDVSLPQRKYTRAYCQWKFKGVECGYVGAESECTKTKQDCKTNKNNYARFGGFPSVPQNRTYIA